MNRAPESSLDGLIIRLATILLLIRHLRAAAKFTCAIGRMPRLCPPESLNDKFMWRKLFDHNPAFVIFCDKLAAKQWARDRCSGLQIPRTLWSGPAASGIPAKFLDQPCFIKASNGSSYNVRIGGGSSSRQALEGKFERWLARPYGQANAEWGYLQVPRQVFVEEQIASEDGNQPATILVYTCHGEPVSIYCVVGSKGEERQGAFFDLDGNRLSSTDGSFLPIADDWILPAGFRDAIGFARELAYGTDQMRCDFLCIGSKVWFSELTPYCASGLSTYPANVDTDALYGDWNLLESWFMTTPQRGWKAVYASALRRTLERWKHDTQLAKPAHEEPSG